MPIYEYLCSACDHSFEVLQGIKDNKNPSCPKCSGTQVKRLISQSTFSLKGGGWFEDGYGRKPPKKPTSPKKAKNL